MSAALAAILEKASGGNDSTVEVRSWLDTGFPPLNKAISGSYDGGMPVGRIIEMFGPESSGKTAIANQVMIAAQKAGGFAIFNDHERSFVQELSEKQGLQVGKGAPFLFKTPDTFEESVTNTIKIVQTVRDAKVIPVEAPIVVVFDSLASMIPKSKLAKDVDEQGMNDSLALAKATSAVFPTLSLFAEKLNMCILVLNQEREKPGVMFGDPRTTPGGKAPKFYSSVRIQLGKSIIKGTVKGKSRPVGQVVTCKVIKNKVSRPFEEAKWKFMYLEDGSGHFDVVASMLDYLVEEGVLKQPGTNVEWIDGSKYSRKTLVKKIENEGLQKELDDLLPR